VFNPSKFLFTISVLMAFIGCGASFADPKLHAFFVVDTKADQVGADTTAGCLASKALLLKVLEETFEGREDRYETHEFTDTRIEKSNLFSFIDNDLIVTSQDTLWFYYCGHGAYDDDDGEYLATSEGNISNKELREKLESTDARHVVITTEKCSSPGDFSYSPPRPTPASWEVFNQLFFQHRGLTEITAATAPQFGWVNSLRGGFFTQAIAKTLCSQVDDVDANGNGFITWEEAFNRIQSTTESLFSDAKENARVHYPDAEILKANTQSPHSLSLADSDRPDDGDIRYEKELRIINNTDNTLCLWIRCYTYSEDSGWVWMPGTEQSYTYEIAPGKSTLLGASHSKTGTLVGHTFEVWGNTGSAKFNKNNFNIQAPDGYRAPKNLPFNYDMWSNDRKIDNVLVRAEYGVYRNGSSGILIQLEFKAHCLKEAKVRFNALFFDKGGNPLKDDNGKFATSSGEVGVAEVFKPRFLHSSFEMDQDDSIELFIPYDELHVTASEGSYYFTLHADVDGTSVFSGTTKFNFTFQK